MNGNIDDVPPDVSQLEMLGELAEELTRRLESGEAVTAAECQERMSESAGSIAQLLPTLRTMVALGEQVARDNRSVNVVRKNKQRKSS